MVGEMRALRAQLPGHITVAAGGAGATMLANALAAIDVRVESSVTELLADLRSRSEQQ